MKLLTPPELWKDKEKGVLSKIKFQTKENIFYEDKRNQAENMLNRGKIELLILNNQLRQIQTRLSQFPEQPSQE